jgi:hypothetical protein
VRETITEWIEEFQAKPWYRPLVLVTMVLIAIDVWSKRGPVVGALAVVVFVGVCGAAPCSPPR